MNVYGALFLPAPRWKQPKCPSPDEWTVNVVCPYDGILLGHKKEGSADIVGNMDGPWRQDAESKKPVPEGHMSYSFSKGCHEKAPQARWHKFIL